MTYQPQLDPYIHLRQVVQPRLATLPPHVLRARIDQSLGQGMADSIEADLEGVFGSLGRAFSSAARDVGQFVQRNGPGLAQIGGGIV